MSTAERYRALVAAANARGLHVYLSLRTEDVPKGFSLLDGQLRIRSLGDEDDIETAISDAHLALDFYDRFVAPENLT